MPSLTAYYTALGRTMDDLASYAAASGGTSTVVISALISAHANASAGRYDGHWVYNATKGLQRMARTGGYTASMGTVTVDPTWTTPDASDAIKITRLFPVIEQSLSDETSYRTLTNRALGRMWLRVPVSISSTTSDRYSLASYPSLMQPEQFVEVREPNPVSGRSPIRSDRGWRVVPGSTPYLQNDRPFLDTPSGSLEVEWWRQASTWIGTPSTYAESSAGLSAETDTALPPVEAWLPFAIDEACGALLARGADAPSGRWAELREQAQAAIAESEYRMPALLKRATDRAAA